MTRLLSDHTVRSMSLSAKDKIIMLLDPVDPPKQQQKANKQGGGGGGPSDKRGGRKCRPHVSQSVRSDAG